MLASLYLYGGQHGHEEIFSKKRHKLRKWVVETSYPHIEELCSKGLDTWPCNKFSHFILSSFHGLVEISSQVWFCFFASQSPVPWEQQKQRMFLLLSIWMSLILLVIKLNNYFSGRVLRNQNQGKLILIPNLNFSLLWNCIVSSKN